MVNETIRPAQASDVVALTRFNMTMALETENKQLDEKTVTAGVQSLIENPAAWFYVLAEQDGEVIAGLMVTYEWSDWRNRCFWWIQSVYVLPSHRRQGVFTRLYNSVKSMAESRDDICGLRLYVEQNNAIAQATYKRLGMDETHYDMYDVEFE